MAMAVPPLSARAELQRTLSPRAKIKPLPTPRSARSHTTSGSKSARPNDLREAASDQEIPKGLIPMQCMTADGVWDEPKSAYATLQELTFADSLLRAYFERSEYYKRNPERPIQAVRAFAQTVFDDITGDLTREQFSLMFHTLKLDQATSITKKVIDGLFLRYDLDHSGKVHIDEFAC